MKVRVFVSLKSTVLDPQGQAVCSALHGLGWPGISAVRQGKFFDIVIADGVSREQAQKDMDTIASDVLANPVIEDFRIELLD
jgi:phosphoribosylformylglycinamidine synthase PurS subunit